MAKGQARQVAALCWRRHKGKLEVLLITSRETRRWVIPKGWPMPPLKDYNAARREAFEEAGIEGRMTRQRIGMFTYAKSEARNSVAIRVAVYRLKVTRERRSWPEMHQRKRQWFDAESAARRVREPGLKKLIRSLAGA